MKLSDFLISIKNKQCRDDLGIFLLIKKLISICSFKQSKEMNRTINYDSSVALALGFNLWEIEVCLPEIRYNRFWILSLRIFETRDIITFLLKNTIFWSFNFLSNNEFQIIELSWIFQNLIRKMDSGFKEYVSKRCTHSGFYEDETSGGAYSQSHSLRLYQLLRVSDSGRRSFHGYNPPTTSYFFEYQIPGLWLARALSLKNQFN